METRIRYARNGDINIAYLVSGEGPRDIVFIQGTITNLAVLLEDPAYHGFCERLSAFSRLILFDKRGMGLSERVEAGTMEDRMDDVRAVLDAAGSRPSARELRPWPERERCSSRARCATWSPDPGSPSRTEGCMS